MGCLFFCAGTCLAVEDKGGGGSEASSPSVGILGESHTREMQRACQTCRRRRGRAMDSAVSPCTSLDNLPPDAAYAAVYKFLTASAATSEDKASFARRSRQRRCSTGSREEVWWALELAVINGSGEDERQRGRCRSASSHSPVEKTWSAIDSCALPGA